MKYKKELLGSYIDILSGFAFKRSDFVECGIPIIKITNINSPNVTLNDLTYVSRECANKQKKFYLSYNDVLIAMTGSHINQITSVVGRVARVKYHKKTLLNQRVGKITIKKDAQADINYIYYFLTQDIVKYELALKAGGAANQANISSAHIKGLEFPCPELNIQKKIGAILSAYDDLIENNQKQIKLLEESAQRLYKEWFVDLHFPCYETTPIIDGVPEGWENKNLSDIAEVVMGQSPKSEFYNKNNEGLPFHQGVANFGERFVLDDIYTTSFNRTAKVNSILFSVRAPVGRINITKNKIAIGRGLAAINHKESYQSFLFYLLKERFFKDNLLGNGSIFASVSKDELLTQKFMIPSECLVKKYNQITENIDLKIYTLDTQIKMLVEARDRLLPKLMNGELEV